MSSILSQLFEEKHQIDPDVISALAPYRTHHINRLGKYSFDTKREISSLRSDMDLINLRSTS